MNQISHKLRLQSELSSMTSRCQRVEEACRVAQKANHGGMDDMGGYTVVKVDGAIPKRWLSKGQGDMINQYMRVEPSTFQVVYPFDFHVGFQAKGVG